MKRPYTALIAIVGLVGIAALAGCHGDDQSGDDPEPRTVTDPVAPQSTLEPGSTYTDFQNDMVTKAAAGNPQAIPKDCGTVPIGGDASTVNCCIASNFSSATPAHATYLLQGIDSQVALGVTSTSALAVANWQYDSDPSGQNRANSARIISYACNDPHLAENVCSQAAPQPFTCSQ